MARFARVLLLLLLVCVMQASFAFPTSWAEGNTGAQQDPQVEALLAQLSPEERVGQLFLVTFPGNDLSAGTVPDRLIRELGVGGVVLRPSNQNYTNDEDTPTQVVTLTNGLQDLALAGSDAGEGDGPYIPLFIAVDHTSSSTPYADGVPESGFSRLPAPLALGATWNPNNATTTGRILGQELESVGINMLLGPNLDITTVTSMSSTAVNTFGGSPYWVGALGRSFIQGVREGSLNQIAIIARHFPGMGSSDRTLDDEIATVQKPSERLYAEDVAPYFAVTKPNLPGEADGLMTTHLRYRALQGNVRQSTRPLSLDAQSLPALLNLPDLAAWRQDGGIIVSDELGAPALRRFYEQQAGSFPARTVARDALNAGNDLLFLGDFAQEDSWDARLANIEETIDFFVEQYNSDPAFAARVDDALRRILALKLKVNGGDFEDITPHSDPTTLETSPLRTQDNTNALNNIAQAAATLLYPTAPEVAGLLSTPPLAEENVVIVTDVGLLRDCADCAPRPIIAPDELANSLLRKYGEQGSGQLRADQLTNLTFDQLNPIVNQLEGTDLTTDPTLQQINDAEWLIFLMQDRAPGTVDAEAVLSGFLKTFNNQLQNRKLIVFTFGSPNVLDGTEISKTTATYAFYTPSPAFVDAAASLLFQEYSPAGVAPITIPSLNYSLTEQLRPDQSQTIDLCGDSPDLPLDSCEPLPATIDTAVSNEIPLRTGIIRDKNGHPVPDGTPVYFILRYPQENVEQPRQRVTTQDGVARAVIRLDRLGQLVINVVDVGLPSFSSTTVQLVIQGEGPIVVDTIQPTATNTPEPTATPTQTVTPQPSATRQPSPTPTVTPTPVPPTRIGQENEGFGWWVFLSTLIGLVAVGGVGAAAVPATRLMSVRRAFQIALFGLGGYLFYLALYTFRLLPDDFNGWGAVVAAVVGGFIALVQERRP